jgi:hypothetical protein
VGVVELEPGLQKGTFADMNDSFKFRTLREGCSLISQLMGMMRKVSHC